MKDLISSIRSLIRKELQEALVLKHDKEEGNLVVFSNEQDPKKASQETFRNKERLKKDGFRWNSDMRAWMIPADKFDIAKETLNSINQGNAFIDKLEALEELVKNSESFQGKSGLMDRINLYVNDLANVTDEKALSAEIRRYMTFFSSFRGHSFFNTLLIWIQRPDATKVAGFRQWEKKFRRVKKGAKGIMIFVPIFPKSQKDADVEDDKDLDKEARKGTAVSFKPGYVFDMSDTEAIDERGEIPELPKWFESTEPTQRTIELHQYLQEVLDNMGINLSYDKAYGKEQGYSKGDHINMTSPVQGAGELSTLIHEFAHELLHWKKTSLFYQGDQVKFDSAMKELQAESVAYIVMKHYELPVQHQPTYLALWKANKEKILANIRVISEVSKFIIDEIEKVAATKANKEAA